MAELLKEAKKNLQVDNEDVRAFLYLIANNTLNEKSERDAKNEAIKALFREGFEIHDPTGTMKIGSKVIQQALWRVMSKIKFLNYTIHGTGESPDVERLVTEGLGTVGDRGGLTTCFRDKGGVFQSAFMFGDGYLMYGKGKNDDNPISFTVIQGEDLYYDSFAWGIRGVRPANKLCVVHSFDKEEIYDNYPELEDNQVYGRIPGSYVGEDEDDNNDQDIIEIGWGYNLAKRQHVIFAGAQAYELDRFEGEEYPFIKKKKPFIPVFQFMCQPSYGQFSNYGIGDMIYDLAVITRSLLNMEITHIGENVLPLTLINAPQTKVDELIEKMAMGEEARAQNKRPIVAMEFDPNGGQQSVATQTLLTQNLFNEWSAIWDRLYREISRLGINLDDNDRGSGITRGQVIAEEESSNAFIKQMQEYNASETKELIECVLNGIVEFVSPKNKSPLDLTTRIRMDDGTTQQLDREITLGQLVKTLKKGNWFVKTDSRTGTITSDLMKLTSLESQIGMTPPGTPEYNELYRQIAQLRGLDMEAPKGQNPANVPQNSGGNEVTPSPPAETQRQLPQMTGNTLTTPI